MKSFFVFALGTFVLVGCGKKEAPKPATPTNAGLGSPLTAPVDYLGAVGKAKKQMEGSIGNVSLGQAIQQFQAQEGRLPKDLNELVTKGYLRVLPKAPYQMKYQYNPQTGEVKVVPAP